jgi:hypothetical protein
MGGVNRSHRQTNSAASEAQTRFKKSSMLNADSTTGALASAMGLLGAMLPARK